jgi:hypothetical protein
MTKKLALFNFAYFYFLPLPGSSNIVTSFGSFTKQVCFLSGKARAACFGADGFVLQFHYAHVQSVFIVSLPYSLLIRLTRHKREVTDFLFKL